MTPFSAINIFTRQSREAAAPAHSTTTGGLRCTMTLMLDERRLRTRSCSGSFCSTVAHSFIFWHPGPANWPWLPFRLSR